MEDDIRRTWINDPDQLREYDLGNLEWEGNDDDGYTLVPANFQERQGYAFEIHDAFKDIDMNRYMTILNGVIDDEHIEIYQNESSLLAYIKDEFESMIDDLAFLNKEKKIQDLDIVLNRLKESKMLNKENGLYIGKTVDYVLKQSAEFIELYISSFIQDCAHAYSGAHGLSCSKGIIERFVLLLGGTLNVICNLSKQGDEREEADGRKRKGDEREEANGRKRKGDEREEADGRKRKKIEECTPDQKALLLYVFKKVNYDNIVVQWIDAWEKKPEVEKAKWKDMSWINRMSDLNMFLINTLKEAGFTTNEILNAQTKIFPKFDYILQNKDDDIPQLGGSKRDRKRKTKRIQLQRKKTRKNIKKTKGGNKRKSRCKNRRTHKK